MPERVQMRRDRPWRADHPDAVIVDRRSCWGNPFVVGALGVPDARMAVDLFRAAILLANYGQTHVVANPSILMLMHTIMECMPGPVPRLEAIQTHLRRRDLACWCPLDQPCHADVLLDIANG